MNLIGRLTGNGKYSAVPEASYETLAENINRLWAVQDAMDRRIRIDSSPLLATLESMYLQVVGEFLPAAIPKTLDQLFGEQLEAVSVLNSSVRSALAQSCKVRDQLAAYRDETVLPKLCQAASRAEEVEREAAQALWGYQQAAEKLASMQITDPDFQNCYRLKGALEKRLSWLGSEKAKADQTTAIRGSELEALTSYEQTLSNAALAMDRLAGYVQAVAQHAAMTQPARQWIRENTDRMDAVYSAYSALSSFAMAGAMEVGEELQRISGMEAAANGSRPLTAETGDLLREYGLRSAKADQQQRAMFEANAQAARNKYGG